MGQVDLHVHTTASDGKYSPEEIINKAATLGLTTIALADHDSVDGIVPALEAARAFSSLGVIPCVEISTDMPGGQAHVLGYFIEVVSGMPFDVFLKERLFDPLGMKDTWFYLPENRAHRLVPVQHKSEDGRWVPFPVTFYDPDYPVKGARRFFSGGAGLCSTARDYANFLQMYLNGGELNGMGILSRTNIKTIMASQTSWPGLWCAQ